MLKRGKNGWEVSRRDFMKGSAVTGVALAAGGELAVAAPGAHPKKPKTARLLQAQCPYCGVGCGTLINVDKNDVIIDMTPDKDHPTNKGSQCIKGINAHQPTYQERLDTVLVRKDMSDPMTGHVSKTKGSFGTWKNGKYDDTIWREATVEEAEILVADKIAAIHNKFGGNSVGLYGSGQLTLETQWIENQLMKGVLGSNTIEANARTCMTSAVTAYFKTFGSDTPPLCYDDIEHADMFTFWGHNARSSHSVMFWRVEAHVTSRLKKKDPVVMVVADPRRTETVTGLQGIDEENCYHFPTINGDISVLNAIAHTIITKHPEAVDNDFLNKNVVKASFEKYIAGVKANYAPEKVAAYAKVDPEMIREVAAKWARVSVKARKKKEGGVLSFWGIGYNQHIHGQHNVISIINLHALTGNIGRPGAGPFSMTGQPNAMGERFTGGLTGRLPFNLPLAVPAAKPKALRDAVAKNRKQVAEAWGVTEAILQETAKQKNPGMMVGQFERALKGDVKAMFYMYTTHVHQPDLNNLIRPALTKMFMVVQDIYYNAPNLLYADVVFPAATWGEWVGGTYINSERRIYVVDGTGKAVDEKGQARKVCRSDMDMAIDKAKMIAKRLKKKDGTRKFTDAEIKKMFPYSKKEFAGSKQYDPEDIFRIVLKASAGSDTDLTGLLEVEKKDGVSPYDQIRKLRGIQWPAPSADIARKGGTKRRYMGQEGWKGQPYANFRQYSDVKADNGKMKMHLCDQVDFYNDPEAKKVYAEMQKMGTEKGYYAIDHLDVLKKARDMALTPEMPDVEHLGLSLEEMEKKDVYPIWLGLGIVYEHFHTAKTIRGTTTLEAVPEQYVEIHPRDARKWKIEEGEIVEVITRRGKYQGRASFKTGRKAKVKPARNVVQPGYIFSPWNLSVADSADPKENKWLVNKTSHRAFDPVSGQVDFKKLAARIRKLKND